MGFISCWASAFVYLSSDNIKDKDKLDAATLYGALSLLTTVAVLSLMVFLLTIKRRYIHTFFSTASGNFQAQSSFLNGKTDAEKMHIFKRNVRLWQSIYPQVSDFVLNNWERWEEEKEDWFSEKLVASIPDDMIPKPNLEALGGAEGRRRSTFFGDQLGGADGRKRSTLFEDRLGGADARKRSTFFGEQLTIVE